MLVLKMNNKIIFLLMMLLIVVGCAARVPMRSWVPPKSADQNIAGKIDYLIIVNNHKGDILPDILEGAFRERFASLPFLEVESSISPDDLARQMSDYNFIPRIGKKGKVALLKYEVQEHYVVTRSRSVTGVTLRHCNYLLEKNKCNVIGVGSLNHGTQNVSYAQTVSISITEENGNIIIPRQKIERGYKRSSKVVPDEIVLRKKVSDLIAREYTKQILPYRAHIEIELLNGDSIAVEMIENGAYSLALKRLEKLITSNSATEKTAENLYLQGVCLEFQNDLEGAFSFYQEALLLEPENTTIQYAAKRLKKAVSITKKSV